jgi:hypothetical protein
MMYDADPFRGSTEFRWLLALTHEVMARRSGRPYHGGRREREWVADRILGSHHLWADTLQTFRKSLAAWTQVPTDHDPMPRFHLQQPAWTRQR